MKIKAILVILLFSILLFQSLEAETTRPYLKTGNWYPNTRSSLDTMLNKLFKGTQKNVKRDKIKALIAPHAGYYYSGRCAAKAYACLKNNQDVDLVFILGIAHRANIYGACVSEYSFNSTPLGKIPVNTDITGKLSREIHFTLNNNIMLYEHSIETQLPFLQRILQGRKFKIVPILFGKLYKEDFQTMADTIKKYITKNSLVIASTDLTHYGEAFGFVPFKENIKNKLAKLDYGVINTILSQNFDKYYAYKRETGITMCGFTPVGILLKLFPEKNTRLQLIDYYKSGDLNNNYSLSVSYASFIAIEKKEVNTKNTLNVREQKVLLQLARKSLTLYLTHKKIPDIGRLKIPLTPDLKEKRGVFVTLKKEGELRGCIGYITGIAPLYKGVVQNTINAAVKDPRFLPVKKKEVPHLSISISVMTPLQKITNYRKIRLGTDGVIIKKGYRQAVYLPQVATETGWSLDQFLASLCIKAGLGKNDYKLKGMTFFVFQAQVFSESSKK